MHDDATHADDGSPVMLDQGNVRSPQEIGDHLGAVLQHADDWARRMISEAETEAARIKERARSAAQKLVADAGDAAERIREEAEADAQRRIEYAEARLEELRESAALAEQRTQALKRRLQSVVERLDEQDYQIELPAGIEIPELGAEVDEHADLGHEEPHEEPEDAVVLDSPETTSGGRAND